MEISGITSSQQGGVDALKAYDQAHQVQRNGNNAAAQATTAAKQPSPPSSENRPIAGSTIGSRINISA